MNEYVDKTESVADRVQMSFNEDGTILSERKIYMAEKDMKNPELVMLAHGFDPKEFDLLSIKNNFWTSYSNEGGEFIHFQSKISLKPKALANELTREDVICIVKDIKPLDKSIKLKRLDESPLYALEIDFADVHIGSLSWIGETGENNDYKIAFEKIRAVVEEARELIDQYPIEKLYLCFLGDFLHIDTVESTTTKGTRVDTDSRPKKVVMKAMQILMEMINYLAVVPTEVIWVEGNHSRLVEFIVFQALPFIFRNEDHISFDVRPIVRKAIFYKGNLIGLHHGEMKKEQLFNWMQVEFKSLWGVSNYVEQHSGHLHQEMVTKEKGGIVQRTNPTHKATDLYEFENGWKSNKVTIAYLWGEKENLKAQFYLRGKQ